MSNRYLKNISTRSKSPDLDLYVKGIPFHLHKTLAKKSAKVTTLLECNKIDELRWIFRDMDIDSRTFELVARFCYGYKIQLSSENILSVLCIANYLEMNDDHSSNNLLNKAVMFLEQQVLTSWNETVKSLRVCNNKILDKLADVGLIDVFLDSLGDELRWIFRDMDIDSRTFELVARFCYGYKIQLSSENILSVLCIANYLEMNDDHSSNNLLNKAVMFLEQQVLTSWNETVKSLRVCNNKILDKLADVGLIDVFLDSLGDKALKEPRLLEDLITLPLRLYGPVILESSKHSVSMENIVASVCNYAKRWVFEKDSGDESVSRYKREVIEAVERLLPHQRGAISCGFLFQSLKESIFLDACSDCRKGFEVRISKQLDMATSKDLLILSSKEDGSYDTELLKNILNSFYSDYNVSDVSRFVNVARMLEEFLFEAAASNAGLKVETFKELAEIAVAASYEVLSYSDGIYKAIDVFLEMHKELIESEKMEACRVLECSKLSPEACEHASKNEKLPLRIVVQVLFFSQKQIRDKVARDIKGVEVKIDDHIDREEEEDDEMENMSKKLLSLDIDSDYSKKREFEKLECVAHCEKEKKVSVWREVKRKFGCMTSLTVDACNCHIKKRKKFHHYK